MGDLVEEKQLLAHPEKNGWRGTNASVESTESSGRPSKYSIDQVRLLKALLEVMASGRESGGWSQIASPSSRVPGKDEGKPNSSEDAKKSEVVTNNAILGKALPHTNYELYHHASTDKQPTKNNSDSPSNSKLLLPILMSCVRIV